MRVLVVDDSEMVRNVLGAMVGRLGHEAVCVGSVAEALAADESDVILLDLELPDGTGYEVARTMRERGERARIYAISGHDGAAKSCLDAGMNGSLRKPFVLDDVANLIGVSSAYIDLGGDEDLLRTMLAGVIDEVPRLLVQ
ncbi:MAG: response regulator, partial [Planctomycetota bacterium]